MRYRVLACDYDRTIALKGVVADPTRRALRDVRRSGRRLVLVTGRTTEEFTDVFDEPELFDRIVLENGALLLDPARNDERVLGPPFPRRLVDELRRREIVPLALGEVICSTAAQNQAAVLQAIADLDLDLKLAPNRDSIMIMPPRMDKASGLAVALEELDEDPRRLVAVGDGENDVALLGLAAVGVAVENAVDQLKERADIILAEPGVDGIRRLCSSLVEHDLGDLLEVEGETAANAAGGA